MADTTASQHHSHSDGEHHGEHTHAAEGNHKHGHTHVADDNHGHGHTHGGHHHVHSIDEKRAVTNRLARAIGHLEAVKQMVERDEDCSDVLIQLAAVRSALNGTANLILKNHISSCIVEAVAEGDMAQVDALNDAIDKFMKS